ncbi:MAG TPA: LysR family transcriptional regulator [Kofleriaceae bacterium]|nr:LysR family transcriptional regulator [Kofleriaceae bacterium]
MTYEWLFAFVTFAEHLNFTRAAKQLHISQPALHVQIKKLADEVGRPLYIRHGRALVLTPEGERLAAHGREVRELGHQVLAELRGERPGDPVVLAAGEGAFLYLLGPAIRRFARRHPLRLALAGAPDAITAVRDARAHLGVVALDAAPRELVATKLRDVGQIVVVPANHRLAGRRSVAAKDLAGEAIVVAPAGRPHRAMVERALHGVAWSVAVEANGWPLMLHFARLGVGIAIVNDFCELPRGMVGLPFATPAITYYVVARGRMSEPAAALRAAILDA